MHYIEAHDLDLARIVKPLVWFPAVDGGTIAYTRIGIFYLAWPDRWYSSEYRGVYPAVGTLELAKAAAQADYTDRTLAALDTDALRQMIADAVAAEREGCARIAAQMPFRVPNPTPQDAHRADMLAIEIAAAIRAGGAT